MRTGRRIAFDYGDVRIGVALSDISGILASPLTTLLAQSPMLNDELVSIFEEYTPIYIALGEPRHLSGSASSKGASVDLFHTQLSGLTSIPIIKIDERLSTVSAAAKLRATGKDAKSRKSMIDAAAAVEILEAALNRERLQGEL